MPQEDFYDTDISEPRGISFDFKGFLFKVLGLWKLIILSVVVALTIAYFINVRKENIYRLSSLVSVESEQNPFFTANTSISFNWGGTSGKVGKIMTTVNTRSHNEKVVDSLQYYMNYLKEGKYRKVDIYKRSPFVVTIDKTKGQLLGQLGIRFTSATTFELFTEFLSETQKVQRYSDKVKFDVNVPLGPFTKTYKIGEVINLPFFNGVISFVLFLCGDFLRHRHPFPERLQDA